MEPGMKRISRLLVAALVAPMPAAAQQNPIDRLAEVLPPQISAQVLERIESARAGDLPVEAMANLALEGVAKGRSGEEVLAAVELLVSDMGRAREVLQTPGRVPSSNEVEAATSAMRMGVDGAAISELARSQPSGRTLAVPLLVMGSLTERGLPSDEALAAVSRRLAAGAGDSVLFHEFPEVAGFGRGMRPETAGSNHAGGLAGLQVPGSGIEMPVGPPTDPGAQGRGRGRGGPPPGM
jgi:hypothetical protein